MDNVTFFDLTDSDGVTITHAKIDQGNGEFIIMPKSIYDTLPSNSSDFSQPIGGNE
jgi:hypothetical protein